MATTSTERSFQVSLASVVEDVLRQHGARLSDIDFASRKAEEAAARRFEAAGWLRKEVGAVADRDLPDKPSEEEFKLGLRNGLILCTVLNKIQPGSVPKVVSNPADAVLHPDLAALSAFQYFENLRNFLVAVQDLGIPAFEASDLQQGGKSALVVDCVLALKSYAERKRAGGHGCWKYGGSSKQTSMGKPFLRKNSENFKTSVSRAQYLNENDMGQNLSRDFLLMEPNEKETNSQSIDVLIREVLSDRTPEEVPQIVGSLLSKVMEEFQRHTRNQNEPVKTAARSIDGMSVAKSQIRIWPQSLNCGMETIEGNDIGMLTKKHYSKKDAKEEEAPKERTSKHNMIFERQQRDIQELKCNIQTTKADMQSMQREYNEAISKLGGHLHILAHSASNYHKVLEENRKLYNQVQDLKGSIRVYCRVRPFLPGQLSSNCIGCIDDGSITVLMPSKYGKEGRRSFNFNKVFGSSASQEDVFLDTQPLIRSILDGYNVCIFAYGQTGSGKTYTMSGPKDLNEQTQGVNYRALSDLFKLSEKRKDAFSYEISVQMIEIYNEQVRDLLVSDGLSKRLEIRNSSQRGVNVPNANLVPVTSTSDVIELMNIGQKNRAVGATALNDRSSRSHSCLTVHVQGRDNTSGTVLRGCMHLVDLAGSERVDKSEVTGERLKEAQHINKSLSALGDVIAALAQKNSHVPYRNSKLTQLLQDSLGGQAKTLMFVHISPEMDAIGETLSTLKFAERVSTVELGAAHVNKENGEIKELKEQIASLKAALATKETGEEQLQNTTPPDINMNATPPNQRIQMNSHDSLRSQSNSRRPMEDVGNIAVANGTPTRLDRTNCMNIQPRDAKETTSGDWIDKLMMNKRETDINNDISMRDWEGDGPTTPKLLCRSHLSGTQDHSNEQYHHRITGYSDYLDVATSDSSENDIQWQFKLQDSQGDSRIKKPQVKPPKSPNIRSLNNLHVPSPSEKMSNGYNRSGKQPNSNNAIRKQTLTGRIRATDCK